MKNWAAFSVAKLDDHAANISLRNRHMMIIDGSLIERSKTIKIKLVLM